MDSTSFLGIAAAVLTTGAFLPQAYKTIKTRSTEDLSIVTFSMLFFGNALWFIYGLYIHNLPLIFANSITALLTGIIFLMKIISMKR